jgi:hypothetical protein
MESSKTTDKTSSDIAGEVLWTRKITFQAAVFLISFLVLFSHRPDAILNAQFYAEDGARFYADAYEFGWRCLLMPYGGYLSTLLRLIGLLTQLVPFGLAPLLMNLCAIAIQILPVNLFLSARFRAIPYNVRVFGSLLYLALPNAFEIHANTTNIQWHLALLALLVLLSQAEAAKAWRYFDYAVLCFALVDGPLGILLVPVAAILLWLRRDRRTVASLWVMIPFAALQSQFILFSNSRRPAPNGASLERLAGILGGQIFLSSVLGVRTFAQVFLFGDRRLLFSVEVAAMIAGLVLIVYGFRSSPFELRLFILFAAGVLILALSHPLAGPETNFPQWEYLQIPGRGSRYYFFPILAFYASLFWLASPGVSKGVRYVAFAFLLLLPIGAYRDWRYPRFADLHFQSYAATFERTAVGDRVTIPINPIGWEMQLVKH